MRAGALLALAVCALAGAPAGASAQGTWLSGWGGFFMDPGTVRDSGADLQRFREAGPRFLQHIGGRDHDGWPSFPGGKGFLVCRHSAQSQIQW